MKKQLISALILLAVSISVFTGCIQPQKSIQTTQSNQTKTKEKKQTPQKSEAILSIDTGGHAGLINKNLIITKSGDIITTSHDKTIRVWDSKTGKEKKKILGQIGAGNEGKIYAIALSPDEQFLAVGGFINSGNGERIRLYNYQSGKLLRILKSHTNVVTDLAFSSDGKYLLSGSFDKTIKLWNMKTFTPKAINFHTNDVYGVKFIKKGNQEFIVSAGYDNKIALHDLKGKLLNSYTHNKKLNYIATKDSEIASCGEGNEILIFDEKLNLKTKIKSEAVPKGLAYSKDGRYLLAGTGSTPNNVNIYDTTKNYTKITSFTKHTNAIQAVAFLDGTTAVSGGGDNKEIYIWDIHTKKIHKKVVGAGKSVWSVGIDREKIAWGNTWTKTKGQSAFEKSFNLQTLTTQTLQKSNSDFNRINSSGLSRSKGGDFGFNDAVLTIKKSGKSITKDSTNGYRHRCYGWYKDYIISGGSNGQLRIYDSDGDEVASLIGHMGDVWSIALDGDRLVSGSGDQTIKVWDLSNLTKSKKQKIYPQATLFVGSDDEWVMWTPEGFFDASENGAKYIGYHINRGSDRAAEYVSVDKMHKAFYRPDLVQKSLDGGDLTSYAKDINIQQVLQGGLAPTVQIQTQGGTTKEKELELNLQVCSKGDGGYDNLTLLLNGMAIDVMDTDRALKLQKNSQQRRQCFGFPKLISLQHGTNKIGFKATNKTGTIESNLDEIVMQYKGSSRGKPDLHILAIGVDKYRDGDLWLSYSVADAKQITKALKTNAGALFTNVYTYQLFDEKVTKANILNKFREVGERTTRDDVFVFYIAGHGITDPKTGSYFYLPADFRYKNASSVRKEGLGEKEFTKALSQIKALKSITLMDTCNSGSFAQAHASRGVLQKTAVDKLTRATGRATLVASSKDQVALEGYKGHGVFTYTLLEALRGKAYKDGEVTIKSMAGYIEDVLPDRTYKKWGYEQVPQSNISGTDFPIGVR